MGYYVNPPDMSKENFLAEKGELVSSDRAEITSTHLPVCLVNNGPFTAAAIGFSQEELDVFRAPDGRPKKWYMVSRSDLAPYYSE